MPKRSRQLLLVSIKRLLADKRFNDVDQWIKVRVGDSMKLYLPGGGPANVAFIAEVQSWEYFKKDEVDLHPNDVRSASTVGAYFDAIKSWYRSNGWTLTP